MAVYVKIIMIVKVSISISAEFTAKTRRRCEEERPIDSVLSLDPRSDSIADNDHRM